jgi:hypothetical protein
MEEELLRDAEGYRTALNGIYRLLSQPELYGKQLTWGVASVLGNNYEASLLPEDTYSSDGISYRFLAAGDYTTKYSTDLIDPIWLQGYRVIANCNNLLAHVERESPDFFPVGETERDMILGELLGVRAMMHFDLLRLFAPSTRADDGRPYIPYVTVFPDKQPAALTVQATLEHIIADLERSKGLLADPDTIYNASRNSSTSDRLYARSAAGPTAFFTVRGTRFNYFAASAILARAYQWRNGTGDMERAYRAALDVNRFSTAQSWFYFTSSSYLGSGVPEDNLYRKMPDDILFALHNNNMYTLVANAAMYSYDFYIKNDDHLFSGQSLGDWRANLINGNKTSRRWTIPTGNQTGWPTEEIIRFQGPLAPVARLSEMRYIMCEYLAETDLPQAISLLGGMRLARGATMPLGSLVKDAFLQELYLEMTREFLTEGQTFYLYKRLNGPMYNGAGNMDMTGRYVLPLPHNETAYINL